MLVLEVLRITDFGASGLGATIKTLPSHFTLPFFMEPLKP